MLYSALPAHTAPESDSQPYNPNLNPNPNPNPNPDPNPNQVLHLQGNELVRVDGLGSLLQLRELVLDRNKIRQLEPHALRGLANLRELRLEENGLRSLDGLAPLPKLQTLCLGNNRILDLSLSLTLTLSLSLSLTLTLTLALTLTLPTYLLTYVPTYLPTYLPSYFLPTSDRGRAPPRTSSCSTRPLKRS